MKMEHCCWKLPTSGNYLILPLCRKRYLTKTSMFISMILPWQFMFLIITGH